MSKRLDENIGTVDYDGLIVTNEPVADVFTVTIRKEASAKATFKRGTVLALSSGTGGDGKMVALGTTAGSNETLTANAILCDDTEIGTAADVERRLAAHRRGRGAKYTRGRGLRPQQADLQRRVYPEARRRGSSARCRHPAERRAGLLREGGQDHAF